MELNKRPQIGFHAVYADLILIYLCEINISNELMAKISTNLNIFQGCSSEQK